MSTWGITADKHRDPVEVDGIEVDEDYAVVTITVDGHDIKVMVKRSTANRTNLLIDIWTTGQVTLFAPGHAAEDDEVGLDIVVEDTHIPLEVAGTPA